MNERELIQAWGRAVDKATRAHATGDKDLMHEAVRDMSYLVRLEYAQSRDAPCRESVSTLITLASAA